MDVTVRRAEKRDAEELSALWLQFLQEQAAFDDRIVISDDAVSRWRNDFPLWLDRGSRHILVANGPKSLVGFATSIKSSPPPVFEYASEVYVEEFFVHPDVRQRGVGRLLYDTIVDWATSWGAQRLRLSVLATNDAGLAFWRTVGFSDLSVTLLAALSTPTSPEPARKKARLGF